ncbi:hypothetical protein QQX98_005643 [Neonectria punicea]|uniref:Uncharacterized protein n=1 Tax=Neonectria punicea TaxID=979145 RepID=A0ABR1H3W0_9HYPO
MGTVSDSSSEFQTATASENPVQTDVAWLGNPKKWVDRFTQTSTVSNGSDGTESASSSGIATGAASDKPGQTKTETVPGVPGQDSTSCEGQWSTSTASGDDMETPASSSLDQTETATLSTANTDTSSGSAGQTGIGGGTSQTGTGSEQTETGATSQTGTDTVPHPTGTGTEQTGTDTAVHTETGPATDATSLPGQTGRGSGTSAAQTGTATEQTGTDKTGTDPTDTPGQTDTDTSVDQTVTPTDSSIPTTSSNTAETPVQESSISTGQTRGNTATTPADTSVSSGGPQETTTASEGQTAPLSATTTAETTEASSETVVTGTDGAIVTYIPSQDPEYATNTGTTTTTDDDGNAFVLFSGGWRWIPIGIPPINIPPPPTSNPDPKDSEDDGDDDEDDDDDNSSTESSESTATESVCSVTAPPQCTKTISYISEETGYVSTELGTCPPVTGCASGQKSTTTTTIISEVPIVWGEYKPEDFVIGELEGEIDQETESYYKDLFEEEDISIEDDENLSPEPECNGDMKVDTSCFEAIYPTFCTEVEDDQSKELTKNLTNNDIESNNEKRRSWSGMQRRRVAPRDDSCDGWVLEFNWSGGEGDCDEDCGHSMDKLEVGCLLGDSYSEGSFDVGCGTYKFKATFDENAVKTTTTSTSEVPESTTSEAPDTTTSEAPAEITEAAKTPLELGSTVCEDEDDFPGHAGINPGAQKSEADFFCQLMRGDELIEDIGSGDARASRVLFDGHDISYEYTISWIDGCETTVERQEIEDPIGDGDLSCKDVFVKVFEDCNNGGVGGHVDAGCLRYEFIGGK